MRSNINQRSSETASLASEGSPQNGRIKQPKRTIIVEPLLVISALSTVPLVILTQQYVFQQEAKLVAIKHGISNYTIPPTSENPCGNPTPEQNQSSPLANFTEEIQAATSKFVIYSNLAVSLPALLVTLFLGAYSDQAGRRYAILPPLVSSFAKVAVYVSVVLADLPVNYLLIGSFVDGFGGGYATLLLGCFAYLADITPPEKRAFRITVAEFCMFASLTLPPLAVGFWIQKSGYLLPFVVVFIGQLLAVLYAVFLIPETVIRNPDARFLTTSHLKDAAAVFTVDHGTNRRLKLNLMLLAFFFYVLVGLGSWQVNSLFQMNHPLCWNSKIIGIFAAVYITIAVVGGMTASRLLKRWMSDDMLCLVACIVFTLQHLYLGFVQNTGMMMIVPLFAIFGFLVVPTTRAIMSKLVLPKEQGALFGAIACVEVVCSLLGSVTFNLVYSATLYFYTGFVFWVMALVAAIGCAVFVAMLVLSRKEKETYEPILETLQDSSDINFTK